MTHAICVEDYSYVYCLILIEMRSMIKRFPISDYKYMYNFTIESRFHNVELAKVEIVFSKNRIYNKLQLLSNENLKYLIYGSFVRMLRHR